MTTYERTKLDVGHERLLRTLSGIASLVALSLTIYASSTSWSRPRDLFFNPAMAVAFSAASLVVLIGPLAFRAFGWRHLQRPRNSWLHGALYVLVPLTMALILAPQRIATLVIATHAEITFLVLVGGFALERQAGPIDASDGRQRGAASPITSAKRGPLQAFGVLSIVFGGGVLPLALLACVGGAALMVGAPDGATAVPGLGDPIMRIYEGLCITGAILLVFSALLITLGAYQLRDRPWALRWSVIWSTAAIVSLGALILIWAAIVNPAWRALPSILSEAQLQRQLSTTPLLGILGGLSVGSMAVATVGLLAPYPVAMLVICLRQILAQKVEVPNDLPRGAGGTR